MDIDHHKEIGPAHTPYFVDVDDNVRKFYKDNYRPLKLDTKRVYISRTYTSEYDFMTASSTPTKTLEDLIRDIGPKEKEVERLQEDSIFQYKGGKGTGFTTGNYYIQRSTSRYIYPVIDDEGSSTNGITGDDWIEIAVLCETEPVMEWEEGYQYMCIAIPEKYGTFTVGRTYKAKYIKELGRYQIKCENNSHWDIDADRHKCFVKIKGSRMATTETPPDGWTNTEVMFTKGKKVQVRGDREHVYTVWAIDIQKSADPLKEDLIRYELTRDDGETVVHPEPMLMPYVEVEPEADDWSDEASEESLPYTWERDIPVEYEEDKRPPTGKTATVYIFNKGIGKPFDGVATSWNSSMNSIVGKIYKDVVLKTVNNHASVYIPKDDGSDDTWVLRPDKFVIVKPNSDDDWGQPEPATEKEIPAELRDLGVKEEAKAMVEDFPILFEGPVGSGKTTIVMELADEYKQELVVDVMTRQTTVNMLMGYKNVNGDYISSKLRDAYELGKMYLLEEINGGDPNVLLCLNTIENGFLSFPDKKIEAHKDFKMFATMNNITNSKDFSGRSVLDLSTRDRFHTIEVHTKYNDRFSDEVVALRDTVVEYRSKRGDTYDASPRDMRRYIHLSKKMSRELALKKTMLKGLAVPVTEAELRNMIKKSEDWK